MAHVVRCVSDAVRPGGLLRTLGIEPQSVRVGFLAKNRVLTNRKTT